MIILSNNGIMKSNIMPLVSTIGFGGIVGFLVGFALKRIMKILAVIAGVFFTALLYLESQHIVNVNWDKLQTISNSVLSTITTATTMRRQLQVEEGQGQFKLFQAITQLQQQLPVNDGKPWYSVNWQHSHGLYNWHSQRLKLVNRILPLSVQMILTLLMVSMKDQLLRHQRTGSQDVQRSTGQLTTFFILSQISHHFLVLQGEHLQPHGRAACKHLYLQPEHPNAFVELCTDLIVMDNIQ